MMKFLNWCRFILCVCLLIAIGVLTTKIVDRAIEQQQRKYDEANLSHMKYDMFSVNVWKKKIAGIVVNEIQKFKMDQTNKEALKKHLEAQLDVLIDKVNEQIKESNKDSAKGWIRQKLMDFLVDMREIKKGIPNYADAIVNQMTADENQEKLKSLVQERVRKYLLATYDTKGIEEIQPIIDRTGTKTLLEARALLAKEIPLEQEAVIQIMVLIVCLSVLLFLLAGVHGGGRVPVPFFFVMWVALCILLYAGVTCPMIDMEARIPKFGFMLLGHNIEFLNQTVYFQSKSIFDVFWLMITHEKIEMRAVGVLMIMFSVVFPVLKLTSSVFYYYNAFGVQKSKFMKAIVLYSGKWSMADVLVVAILMSYIGFNGMVTTQMELIAKTVPEMTFISTNGTIMQVGFYIFLTYAILAMFFSGMSKVKKPEGYADMVD